MDVAGMTMGLFENNGINVVNDIEDPGLARKKELVDRTKYMGMSQESESDLRDRAVKLGLIPPDFRNATFDNDKIRSNITRQQNMSGHKFHAVHYEDYFQTAEDIINCIRVKQLPMKSYLLGAPNGFGKQSFATDCILASLHNGWVTVPYISLLELAEIKTANDKVLLRGLMGVETNIAQQPFSYVSGDYVTDGDAKEVISSYSYIGDAYTDIKSPVVVTGRYSWSEYINAPILICFFSGIENKAVESQLLYTLLNIRSAKGFPTIAMISTSLTMYERDPVIGKHVWKEIKSYDAEAKSYGRVYHVSCYKSYSGFDKK